MKIILKPINPEETDMKQLAAPSRTRPRLPILGAAETWADPQAGRKNDKKTQRSEAHVPPAFAARTVVAPSE